MYSKLVFLACLLLISWLSSVSRCKYIPANQYQSGDSDVEFVTGSPGANPGYNPGGIPGYPQGPTNIFKDWMNFVQGFFKEGNWDNGGPGNLAKFIGNQISKLMEMLTRDDTYQGKK